MAHINPLSRRRFIQASAASAAWALTARSYSRILGANAQLNVAYIGVGGIASSQHIPPMHEFGCGCPCFCDVDTSRWGAAVERWSDARGFTDYRRMYDAHMADIDAVMVGTPDHSHYPATIIGMMEGKHAYTQKPLTHTPWEARQLAIAAEKYKLATQMGNQGHATENLRKTIDYLRSGAIGDLKEAHVWTNRPWWRQGMETPEGGQPVPENLDWESWLGPAPKRPFRHDPADNWGGWYHPFNWRGFWDFGCGALGDMACHELDPLYWALEPGYPTSMELFKGEPFGDADQYAEQSVVKLSFPAKDDRPGFDVYWYEGGLKPDKPEEMEGETTTNRAGETVPVELTGEGAIYIGTKCKMIAMPDARSAPRLLPRSLHEEHGTPPQMIERSTDGHHGEWYKACIGEKPYTHPKSNFAYAGPFTEFILLACIAQRIGGKLEYDPQAMRFTNNDNANALVTKEYHTGWDFRM